ncbi:hypothetical protein CRU87_09055 [Aliarcobacter trophiarum LMG 25534]|uniref:Peptidase, M48 family n=1 Tax=Aliarcobacter trophiarum LMG 25534 TaxID=1032241 RepID=A0AAD0VM02_9BACT|nr:M48 family metallopeptidase [Aliarcobacter trophiarum]AXK48436.1 peptidase, M48 family [Aliarcobacter trophiarum LMG 25534]RXI26089.1 hypothetical protein CRU89_07125 [Aliarcobacter trophiarum]RXJ89589.1 hypothetical protein CRU87_09055 [Aliarcobacter trophiarum LMG 25534]
MKKLVLILICSLIICKVASANKDYIGNTLKIFDNLTPEEEFLIGKMQLSELVTSNIHDAKSQKVIYLNNIVNSLVLSSDKPYVYDGYKVILVEDKSLNAMALPGGIIVVNDGIFTYLENEDQLASILAHEIGHIQEKHNLHADKSFKIDDAVGIASNLGIAKNVDNQYARFASVTLLNYLSNSIVNGYGVSQEVEADTLAIKLLVNAGYDPKEFLSTLNKLKETTNSYGGANYPVDRLTRLEPIIKELAYDQNESYKLKDTRKKRFQKLKNLK